MNVDPIGWKHFVGGVLIVATVVIVIARRDRIRPRMILAITLMTLGTVFTFAGSVFQLGFGFVDFDLAAIVSWTAALVLALSVLHGNDDTSSLS